MEERALWFSEKYCEGVYHGRLGDSGVKMRLERFEDNWYIADGTGNVDAVVIVDKDTSMFITEFYPDAKITAHLYVIENLRQGAAEIKTEHAAEIENLNDKRGWDATILTALNVSYDKLLAKSKAEASDYQAEIDDLKGVLSTVRLFNEDVAGKLTKARERYNDLSIKLHGCEAGKNDLVEKLKLSSERRDALIDKLDDCKADNTDLDKRNMGLIGQCQMLEDKLNKFNEFTLIPSGKKVAMNFAFEQYAKVQDYVVANKLHMGHEDEATHADILIDEHGYLFTKIQTIRNAAGLKDAKR